MTNGPHWGNIMTLQAPSCRGAFVVYFKKPTTRIYFIKSYEYI